MKVYLKQYEVKIYGDEFEKVYKDHIYFDSAKKAIDYMKHFVKYHRFNNLTLTLNEYRSTLERVVHLGGMDKDLTQLDLSMTMGFSKVNHNSLLVRYDQRKGEMEIIK